MEFNDFTIRFRFLCLLFHLFLVLISFLQQNDISENIVQPVLETKNEELQVNVVLDDVDYNRKRFTTIFTLSIALISVELISFLSGISMLTSWHNQLSILCHFIGTCLLISILYYQWSELAFYSSFIFCTTLPSLLEMFPILKFFLRSI